MTRGESTKEEGRGWLGREEMIRIEEV